MPMTTPKVMARLDTTIRATVADFWAMFAKFIWLVFGLGGYLFITRSGLADGWLGRVAGTACCEEISR